MKTTLLAAAFTLIAASAWAPSARADDATCTATATGKSLAGAAKTSFMKKCTTDATTKCNAAAKEKNLHGAAQTSFTKKCVADAVGS